MWYNVSSDVKGFRPKQTWEGQAFPLPLPSHAGIVGSLHTCVKITESDIWVLMLSSLTTAKSTCKVLPAGHVGDITLLNGGDPLELTVIPHGLLQRHIIKVYCKETLISLILLVVQLIKDYKILTSPVLAASTTFFLNHSTGPSTVVCMNLNPRLLHNNGNCGQNRIEG